MLRKMKKCNTEHAVDNEKNNMSNIIYRGKQKKQELTSKKATRQEGKGSARLFDNINCRMVPCLLHALGRYI